MLYPNCIICLYIFTFLCLSILNTNQLDFNIFTYQEDRSRLQERQLGPPINLPSTTSSTPGVGGSDPATTSTSSPVTKTSTTTSANQPPTSTSASTTSPNITLKPSPSPPPTSTQQATSSVVNPITSTETLEPSTTIELITSIVTVSGSVLTSVSSSTEVTNPSEATNGSSPTDNVKNNNSSGMSPKTRNTIIGVVVGIGGTAIIAGLILVVRRIFGRRNNRDYNNGLMDFGTIGMAHDKTGLGNTRPVNPFQSTLENYHNPARVNASSNF